MMTKAQMPQSPGRVSLRVAETSALALEWPLCLCAKAPSDACPGGLRSLVGEIRVESGPQHLGGRKRRAWHYSWGFLSLVKGY